MRNGNKKTDKLFSMLLNISTNLKDAGKYFYEYKISGLDELKEFSKEVKEFELKGDTLVGELIKELNNTFITPIEREDALELAANMDDILDGLEECAAHFYMYNIIEIDKYMIEFSEVINKCIDEIYKSTELLSKKKLTQIREHTVKIKEYEEQCDTLERHAIRKLFEREKDFVKLIQNKEIYEILENIADCCKKVGKVLETVIMKNA